MDLIHGGPPALPGSCYTCNSGTRKRYFDWKTSIEFHGAFYICDECVIEMASKLDMLLPEKANQLVMDNMGLKDAYANLLAENSALKDTLNGFDDIRDYLSSPSVVRGLPDSPGTEISGGEEELDGGKEKSSEPSDDEGVGKLSTSGSGKSKLKLNL